MKAIPFLLLLLCLAACSNPSVEVKDDPCGEYLETGLYLFNGDCIRIRQNVERGGRYPLGHSPIVSASDFLKIDTIKESTGMYSLDFELRPIANQKWQNMIKDSSIYYIGFVLNDELVEVIKAHDVENDKLKASCIASSKGEIIDIVRNN